MTATSGDEATRPARPLPRALLKLARPAQWSKGAFVLVGPMYHLAEPGSSLTLASVISVLGAFLSFSFASSACYVFNDLRDREVDRSHPRKRHRPIASGEVSPRQAAWFIGVLLLLSLGSLGLVVMQRDGVTFDARWLVLLAVGTYCVNVTTYSLFAKHVVILDVISLAAGFVLRVLAGCAAMLVLPSTWLLNVTFFLAMFLAFGKRLGERRTMGADAANARSVQSDYTDAFLQMAVVVTAVTTLLTYAGYVQAREADYTWGLNLLWLTILPATYGMLRCIVLVDRGTYDDPTELATHDRPFQLAMGLFALVTVVLVGFGPSAVRALGAG